MLRREDPSKAWREPFPSEKCKNSKVLFFGFGLSTGVWITLSNELYGDYFSSNQDIAFNLWNVLFNVGLFVFYAISTIFCVYVKIYILMTALTLAMFLYVVSQCWFGYVSTFCSNT